MNIYLHTIKGEKHAARQSLLLTLSLVMLISLGIISPARSQITLSTPATTGDYTDSTSITLSPDFSTGGNFSARILLRAMLS